MALAKVSKINIIAHQNYQTEFLEVLQNLGFTQTEDYQDQDLSKVSLSEKIAESDYQIAGVKFSLDFLANHETEKKSLADKINPKINLTLNEIEKNVKDFDYQAAVKEIQAIESGINQANSTKDKLTAELNQIQLWQKLDFIPNRQNKNTGFDFKFISINENFYHPLVNQLQKTLPLSEIEQVSIVGKGKQKEILAVLFFSKEKESIVTENLANFNTKIIELPNLENTIPERIKEINHKITETESRTEKLIREAERLALNQKNLKIVFDYLSWQKDKLINQQKAGSTWQTFSLLGFIDQDLVEPLKKELAKITDDFTIEKLEIDPEESIPIIFKNSWAGPFESVTDIYGAPSYSEPDPTPFLAPFFILFFGLCLTDAGYGIVLAVLAWLAIKILKLPKENQKLLKVLMYGGIVTFVAGALVGGWFGIVIDDLKIEWLKNLLVNIRMIDPVKEPIKMLLFSLALGVIQIITGLIISIYWKIKQGDIKSAILDSGMWLYFLLAILFWGATKVGLVEFQAAKYLVWAGVLGLILTQGRSAKNPFLKLASGVISLYGLVGYFSDILSYSRLLALGLATGIIAMVINLIAKLTIDMVPYVGWIIAIVILVGGHIFNLVINTLGAFIHSSRLQFVEFFPKFMGEGGGKIFQPFRKEAKYIRITK